MIENLPIGVVDVGLGNVNSIHRMIERAGGRSVSVVKASDLKTIRAIILPGVGHFDAAINAIRSACLSAPLRDFISDTSKPVLGICLGMHLLCRCSEEGVIPGLGFVNADVKKFRFSNQQNYNIPHMGWNVVESARANPLLPFQTGEHRYYFVHSYRVLPDDPTIIVGHTDYGGRFCAAFQQGNIFGVQFHPEKSHRFGLELMKRFVAL
ncbi:imidazole glycerol phosphate synthase subunit HisH [beta proteobacterium MWH-UniP1]